MKNIFSLTALYILCCSAFLQAQKPETIQYINPLHKSTLNSRTSQIIIRPGGYLGGGYRVHRLGPGSNGKRYAARP